MTESQDCLGDPKLCQHTPVEGKKNKCFREVNFPFGYCTTGVRHSKERILASDSQIISPPLFLYYCLRNPYQMSEWEGGMYLFKDVARESSGIQGNPRESQIPVINL